MRGSFVVWQEPGGRERPSGEQFLASLEGSLFSSKLRCEEADGGVAIQGPVFIWVKARAWGFPGLGSVQGNLLRPLVRRSVGELNP